MKKMLGFFSVVIGIALLSYEKIIEFILRARFLKDIDSSGSSVAIIGGADGPTAIYVTSSSPSPSFGIIKYFLAVLLIGVVVSLWIKRTD